MTDYFFPYVDARAQLAGARVVIENYLAALETNSDLQKEVCLKLLSESLEEIKAELEKEVA